MRVLLSALLLFIVMSTQAQPRYQQIRDKDTKDLIYVGQIMFQDLEKEPEFKWFNKGISAYEPDAETINYLREHLRGYEIITLIGTWCSDSHDMVPKLYKVLKQSDFNMRMYTMYALDIAKKGNHKEEQKYNVDSVPTIILLKNGKEAGRIVETVTESIELDLKDIIEFYEDE